MILGYKCTLKKCESFLDWDEKWFFPENSSYKIIVIVGILIPSDKKIER